MRRGQIAYCGPNPNFPMDTAYDFSKIAPINQIYEDLMASIRRNGPESGPRRHCGQRPGRHIQFLQEAEFELFFAVSSPKREVSQILFQRYDKPTPYLDLETDMYGRVKKLVDEYGTQAKVRGELIDPLINRSVSSCAQPVA